MKIFLFLQSHQSTVLDNNQHVGKYLCKANIEIKSLHVCAQQLLSHAPVAFYDNFVLIPRSDKWVQPKPLFKCHIWVVVVHQSNSDMDWYQEEKKTHFNLLQAHTDILDKRQERPFCLTWHWQEKLRKFQ